MAKAGQRPPRKKPARVVSKRAPSTRARPRALGKGSQAPRFLTGVVAALGVATLLGQFDRAIWLGSVAQEFGFLLFLVAVCAAGFAAYRRAIPALLGSLAIVVAWALPLVPLLRDTRPTPQNGPTLRVASSHLTTASLSPSDLVTFLVSNKVEVGLLTADHLTQLTELAKGLPGYQSHHELSPQGPWVLFVKKALASPLSRSQARDTEKPSTRRDALRVRVSGCDIHVQPLNVVSLLSYRQRSARTQALKALSARPKHPRSLWLGHLGSSPKAADVQPLLSGLDLRDGRSGHGRIATYPAFLYGLGFPHDALLLQGWLRVTDLRADPPLEKGAHRTLRATIEITDSSCKAAQDPIKQEAR